MQDWCIQIGNRKGEEVPQFNYAANAACHRCSTQYASSEPISETAYKLVMRNSKGDGQAEKAVQSIEEIVRTLFIDLEQRCGEELSVP